MTDLMTQLTEEWQGRAGEIALAHDTQFVRFLGIGEDSCDIYYICDVKTGCYQYERQWFSAVGALEPLKGFLRDEDQFVLEAADTDFGDDG